MAFAAFEAATKSKLPPPCGAVDRWSPKGEKDRVGDLLANWTHVDIM